LKDWSKVPLADLRQRLETARTSRARLRLARALAADERQGARALARWVLRQEQARRKERRRVARLFATTRRARCEGACHVAGVDEVGVGPLAGPVVAAAVILPERIDFEAFAGLDDSKVVTRSRREALAGLIRERAVAVCVAEVAREEIDRLNIYRAALEAMRRAVVGLAVAPDHVLVDARSIPEIAASQTAIFHGDSVDASIAAASIVAKVHRDAIMSRLDRHFPGYDFGRNMGYGTRRHLEALRRLGPTPVHRRSFAPVSNAEASAGSMPAVLR
jgi:ribonuclease HII